MKSIAKFSACVGLAALLCFAPCAVAESTVHNKLTTAGSSVLRYAPPSFLAFAFGPGGDGDKKKKWCKGQDECKHVPEGGAALMYLLLAGLCCLGAVVLRYRRQADVRATN